MMKIYALIVQFGLKYWGGGGGATIILAFVLYSHEYMSYN